MNNIDPSRIRWIKNVKRDGGQSWAYFEDYSATNQHFALHWPHSKRGNAKHPNKGDIIILFQNYKNQGPRLTHLVEVVDDNSFIDSNNPGKYETAREVKLIYRSKRIINVLGYRYKAVAYGTVHSVHFLDLSKNLLGIQQEIYDLFKNKWKSSFFVVKHNGESFINIPPNKLYNENQIVKLGSKIITLIGENGSGKSAILESIFESSIYAEKFKFVCFSSGQNERFTNLFAELKPKIQDSIYKEENSIDGNDEYESSLKVFYFNKTWVRLIIALATSYCPMGRVRSFLESKGYCDVNNGIDITTKFIFQFNIQRELIRKIQLEREKEDNGVFSEYLHNRYFETIDKIRLKYFPDETIDSLSGKGSLATIEVKDLQFIFGSEFELPINLFRIDQDKLVGVFSLKNSQLFFRDMEMNDLSDGEFQIISIFALLDLFDSIETFFLFDEIDSHLYYRNIENLWTLLKENIIGNVITTTHIADSIIQNEFHSLRIVERGKVLNDSIANELKNRFKDFSNNLESYYKVVSKIPYFALVEDESDWIIFKELAKIKLGNNYSNSKIETIQVIKCSSGYSSQSERLGSSKKDWSDKFIASNSSFTTKAIFMICDRDEFTLNDFHRTNGVEIIGTHRYNKKFNNQRSCSFLLSWKRRQIENYLLSYTMLSNNHKLEDINSELGDSYRLAETNPMDIRQIQDLEIKTKIQSLYVYDGQYVTTNNPEGIDYVRLLEVIKDIPASEISEDIEKMYNFIVSKIN